MNSLSHQFGAQLDDGLSSSENPMYPRSKRRLRIALTETRDWMFDQGSLKTILSTLLPEKSKIGI